MYRGAIGIIETLGLVGATEAADAMTKCAHVDLLGREQVGGGYFAVGVRGDVGAVRAALEAGEGAARKVGELSGVLFLPRPHDATQDLVQRGFGLGPPALPSRQQLDPLNVHDLRALARGLDGFPLQGRELSKANRGELEAAFERFSEQREAR